ncbi:MULTISPECIES: DUF934 domain-containing protein [unclassified Aminobacter]|uniref:DUF934 domain-containing protein n=1 Tax=unclassified Aminobacter TaxID=2644704 RepID=UPI000465A3A1|nr:MULTISPECIES: DUF934 domain-containing protein [unclassified Aminobacter]TWG49158.1 uncharacterized protein (DUF934 family) [Aminobacter sp. J44]TWH30844.1 uncharacterized protein (DUF934 family) [Aminobacter sp. J15]
MSETDAPAIRLWTEEGFRDDQWIRAEDAQALAGNLGVILPLAAFLALDETTRTENAARLGVHLEPGEQIAAIVPFLATLPLVSLGFPAFNDGRSYSKAQLLRTRHGYKGAIRASGEVLIDQIPLMLRTGFSEFEVSNETALKRLEEGRVGGIAQRYQPAARAEAAATGFSWRRKALA